MLDLLLLVSTAAFILAGSAVGIRLLAVSWRTRELTDFAIALAMFVLAGITYPLMLAGNFGGFSLETTRGLVVANGFTSALGFGGVVVFTQRAFRPGLLWSRVLSGFLVALLFYGAFAGALEAQHAAALETLRASRAQVLFTRAAAVAIYAWTSLEGVRCWLQARRRMAIGLADPLVVNRFLLWALIGVFALCSVAPAFALALAGKNPLDSQMARLATGIAGVGCAVAMQLAFLPPARYRRWIAPRAAA